MAAATAIAEINKMIFMKIWTSLPETTVHYPVAKIIVAAGTFAEVQMTRLMVRRRLCVKITQWTQPSFLLSANSNSSYCKIRLRWPLTS